MFLGIRYSYTRLIGYSCLVLAGPFLNGLQWLNPLGATLLILCRNVDGSDKEMEISGLFFTTTLPLMLIVY